MYCVKCGVKLADTEQKCPLCNTTVYHPDLPRETARELYPKGRMPKGAPGSGVLCGVIIFLMLIPLFITFFSDIRPDGRLDWFGYVAGAMVVAYVAFALPLWFKKPNPVIFVPCTFAASALYLLYIDLVTEGDSWFLGFALPIVVGLALIACTLTTLLRYLRRGKLYVLGGTVMALGGFVLMIELLAKATLGLPFVGWSLYPMAAFVLIGGALIFVAISPLARESVERRLFF